MWIAGIAETESREEKIIKGSLSWRSFCPNLKHLPNGVPLRYFFLFLFLHCPINSRKVDKKGEKLVSLP